jgi:ABC-2 type transport system permease protein
VLGASVERVVELVRKELLQTFRDPRMLRVLLVAPIIQLVVFGYAVTTDYRHTPAFVVDQDHTRISRELIEQLTSSQYFEVRGASPRAADLVRELDRGTATLGIVIPPGFQADLEAGRPARVQLLVDGTNSNLALVAQGYAESIVQSFGARVAFGTVEALAGPVELRERAWFNPDLRSRDYNVPAVMGMILLLVCLLLTALAVVREREVGTLEQLMVSPLRAGELILGKTLPFALVGLVDMLTITTVALLWFDVPFRGSFALLTVTTVLYLACGLGIGLLISTVSATQQEAFMTTFLVIMPIMLLSGFMFPVTSMPEALQKATLLNPMRHYLEVVRGVFLKGAGVGALWPQLLAMAALGTALLGLAAARFRKRIA